MCNALCECLKCPGKVVCCCCKCACNMLLGFIFSGIVLLVIIFVILWFTVFNKDSGTDDKAAKMIESAPTTFRELFKSIQ